MLRGPSILAVKCMGWNDHIDWELHELVTDLPDEGYLEEGTPAYGIAKLAVDVGYERLSPKQKAVYDAVIVPALTRRAEYLEAERHKD
jgi:hypothetical protein